MSKQDRQGVRTPAGLEQKYDLGKSLSNLEAKAKANAEQISKQGQRIDSISENQDERFSALEKGISIAEKNIDTLKENVNSLQIRMTNSEEHSLELENEVWSLARRITATEKVVEQLKQAQAVMVDINSLYRRFTPRNLLDNSDFRNPVNQRGISTITTTSATYTIDRWRLDKSKTLTVNDDSITITGGWLTQLLEPKKINSAKTYTAALYLGDDSVIVETGVFVDNTRNTYTGFGISGDGIPYFGIITAATIKKIALYEGEYTEDTLPEYQPKGCGAELAECQRYYQVVRNAYGFINGDGTAAYMTFPLAVPMRINPSISNVVYTSVRGNGNNFGSDGSFANVVTADNIGVPMVMVKISDTFTDSANHAVTFEGYVHFSADL